MPQHEDCAQEANIVNISRTLERMERGQERVVELLEKVANQDARIDHLEDTAEIVYRDVNSIFDRVRDLELVQASNGPETRLKLNEVMEEVSRKMEDINNRIEKILRFYRVVTGKNAKYFYTVILGLVLTGFVSDIANHYDWMKETYKLIKFLK